MKPRAVWVIVLATILVGMIAGGTALAAGENIEIEWTLTGTPRDDVLRGTNSTDYINAKAGDDTVHGLRGWDFVNGGRGADKLYGNRSGDSLHGNSGADKLYGNLGGDYIEGGKGKDVLYGGDGNDLLVGGFDGGKRDKLYCGKGRDEYYVDKSDYVAPSCEVRLRN
jgi:Ca2+-binding RTX toxin-like protein